MKSARFANVVAQAGKPDVHLLLIEPKKDASLQKAIKANRVMTVHQTGTSDFGVVGFESGVTGQVLVFPKSLKSFEGARVVGIKYDLLQSAPIPRSKQFHIPEKPKTRAPKRPTGPPAAPAPAKVLPYRKPDPPPVEEDEEDQRVLDLENGIRHAMEFLEAGRQVAAFNILKRLIE